MGSFNGYHGNTPMYGTYGRNGNEATFVSTRAEMPRGTPEARAAKQILAGIGHLDFSVGMLARILVTTSSEAIHARLLTLAKTLILELSYRNETYPNSTTRQAVTLRNKIVPAKKKVARKA